MLNALSQKFHAWATGWRVLLLLAAYALLIGYILPVAAGIMAFAANNHITSLDLMFFYTPAQAFEMMDKYGAAGRAIYSRIELTVDIIYPIVYTLFYGLLISWLFQRAFKPESSMQLWNIMPVGAWFFDLLENLGIVSMLALYPSRSVPLAWLTMILGSIKWAFAFGSVALVLVGLVKAAMNGFVNKCK